MFGGSVAKRTYVDGLSDINFLVIINETDLGDKSRQVVLDHMEKMLRRRRTYPCDFSRPRPDGCHGRIRATA